MYRGFHKMGAVQYRPRPDAWRQGSVDFVNLGVRRCGYGSAVAADQHQRGPENHFVPVDASAARSQLTPKRHLRDILDSHGNGPARRDNDLLDLAQAFNPSAQAHDVAFTVAL